jgi:hypothetical protein
MELVLLLDALRADEDNIGAEGTIASAGGIGKLGELVGLSLIRILEGDELHKTCGSRSLYMVRHCRVRQVQNPTECVHNKFSPSSGTVRV